MNEQETFEERMARNFAWMMVVVFSIALTVILALATGTAAIIYNCIKHWL